MAIRCKNNFSKGVVLDLDNLRIPPDTALWIKDMTIDININASNPSLSGGNKGVRTPTEGNVALSHPTYPSGTNYCIGTYSSEQTNELYYFLYNSSNNHSVWVINGDNGVVSKVYQDALLGFVLDPKYFISEGRCTLELRSVIDPVSGVETNYKFLIFTYNLNNQFFIEVTSAIATNSFSTTYFSASAAFYNPLELIHLGVPTPLVAIGLNTPTAYAPSSGDLTMQNLLVRSGWQFRLKFVDIFGRESEHGIISSQYITLVGGGCIQASNGLPRCLMLNFDAGNPLVNQMQIEFRKWVGDDRSGALAQNWQIYEIINKYDNSTATEWYNRSYNPLFTTSGSGVTFNAGTNLIAYTFCADKNQIPIDPAETSRTEPGLARISSSAFSINKRIGLANNVRDFQPIPQSEIDKITFGVQTPSSAPCPAAPLRTITFFANIYRPIQNGSSICRLSDGVYVWGNRDGACSVGNNSSFGMDQVFADQSNPGFIAYIAGTPYACVSQQGDYDLASLTWTYQGISPGIHFPNNAMQRFVIKDVPACKGLLRISSHKSKITDENYQGTSTYVAGICNISEAYGGDRHNYALNPIKEIEFDCTSGDVTLQNGGDPMFLILDIGDGNAAVDGYLYESVASGNPIEMNPIIFSGTSSFATSEDAYGSFFTDHNGFYFAMALANDVYVNIYFDDCKGGGFAGYLSFFKEKFGIQHGDGAGTPAGACAIVYGNPFNRVYVYGDFPSGARREITQQIAECSSHTTGVPGVVVVMTKGAVGVTNTSGIVTLIAHNRYNYNTVYGSIPLPYLANLVPDYSTSPGSNDSLIFSQKGGCEWTACGGCVSSMADVTITYVACGGSRNTTLSEIFVNVAGINIFGVQSGGKYPVAVWFFDVIGRHTAPQSPQGVNGFVTIPNLNDVGYQQFALSQLTISIDSSFAVNPVFTKMSVLVGANILFTDFFSWSADWVQLVDNTGGTNSVNPTAIRIYYGSLNEYNKQNNFSSNTGWQFITTGSPTSSPVDGDIAQFIMNGDGSWLTSVISAPITYDDSGLFFTLDYLQELTGLVNGCLFRVIRPSQNQSGEDVPVYEQNITIPIVNGIPTILTSVIPYFDSYLLQRLLPVPLLKGQTGPISPGGTPGPAVTPPATLPAVTIPLVGTIQYTSSNNDPFLEQGGYSTSNVNNKNGVVEFQIIDYPTSFPFFFESPSPADTWGSHVACRGRIGVANPYEQQQRTGTEVALSDAFGDRGIFNGLSYFEDSNIEVFDRNTWGDITVILVETSIILVICDRNHFTSLYNGSTVRQDASGNLIAMNQNGIFTSPVRKAGTNYGCGMDAINTIRKYAGIVHWLDTSGYLVTHNFSTAESNTDTSGYQAYLLNKISFANISNLNPSVNGVTFFHGSIDPKTMKYTLTSFNYPPSLGAPSYLNTLTQENLAANETLIFDLYTCAFENSASYTAEYYAPFPSFWLQRNFLAFKNGVPYIQHNNFANNVTPPPYANYFGVQCLPRVTFVVNEEPDTVKRYLWIEVYCNQTLQVVGNFSTSLFLADVITTDKGQLSRILTPLWIRKDGYSTAFFICDLNTPADPNLPTQTGINKARDGNPLIGKWIQISLVPQSSYAGTYFELSNASVYVNGIQKPDQK